MTTSPANWTGLFYAKGASYGDLDEGVEICIDDEPEEVTEVTSDMMVAMPDGDDDPDLDLEDFEDVTEDLVPLEHLAYGEEPEDQEQPSQPVETWPRSFEEHKRHLERATRDAGALQALAIFGMGDVQGNEACAAAIIKTWEDLRFWEPMLELGRSGDFSGHLADLRKCAALLEANPPAIDRPKLLECWEQARAILRTNLPGKQAVLSTDLRWQQNVAKGRNATISVFHEEVA